MKISIKFTVDDSISADDRREILQEILDQATRRAMLASYARTDKAMRLLDREGKLIGIVRVQKED